MLKKVWTRKKLQLGLRKKLDLSKKKSILHIWQNKMINKIDKRGLLSNYTSQKKKKIQMNIFNVLKNIQNYFLLNFFRF